MPGLLIDSRRQAARSAVRIVPRYASRRRSLRDGDCYRIRGAAIEPGVDAVGRDEVERRHIGAIVVISVQELPHHVLADGHAIYRVCDRPRGNGRELPGHSPRLAQGYKIRIERAAEVWSRRYVQRSRPNEIADTFHLARNPRRLPIRAVHEKGTEDEGCPAARAASPSHPLQG